MKVYTSDGFEVEFDRQYIARSLIKEANLEPKLAEHISRVIEGRMDKLGFSSVNGSLVRAMVVDYLRAKGYTEAVRLYAPITISLHESLAMNGGEGDNDNANQMASPETAHKHKADYVAKKEALRILPEHLANGHRSGDYHIHDLDYFTTRPFCKSHDMRYFFRYGFVPDGTGMGASAAGPAMHAEVAVLQAVKVLGMAQTQYSGGQGLLHFLTFLSPYLEGKSYKEIKQLMQMMVYELNQMYVSRGGQAVFSSVNLTPGVPEVFKNAPAVYRGKVSDRKYGEFEREVRLAFEALISVAMEGDHYGRPFPFPKLEISLERAFLNPETWEQRLEGTQSYKELYLQAFELAAYNGTPYFDNLLPEYRKADGTVACYQCCSFAFHDDSADGQEFQDKLNFKDGAHFDLGGMQVVSLNLPRLAYRANGDKTELWKITRELVNKAVDIYKFKRDTIRKVEQRLSFALQKPIDKNTHIQAPPYTDLDKQVFELGIVGLADMAEIMTGVRTCDDESSEGRDFAREYVSYLGMLAKGAAYKNGITISVARTPAETTAQRFAVMDMIQGYTTAFMHGDIECAEKGLQSGKRDLPVYYSNGIAPWVGEDISLFERLGAENAIWPAMEGGAISHIFLGERWTDPEGLMDVGLRIARNTNVGYFAFTKDFTVCADCHHIEPGVQDDCVACGSSSIDVQSRITGYLSPVSRWNAGKAQEFKDRYRNSL